jgi:hypothetical protein
MDNTQTEVKPIIVSDVLKLWEHPRDYYGETYYGFYPVVGRHRDSDVLDRSNFEVALEQLGGESDTVIVARASHWAVGWVESILVDATNADAVHEAEDIRRSLEDYPVLDDMRYSEMEWEEAESVWQSLSQKERAAACKRFGIDARSARSKSIPRDDNGELYQWLITP